MRILRWLWVPLQINFHKRVKRTANHDSAWICPSSFLGNDKEMVLLSSNVFSTSQSSWKCLNLKVSHWSTNQVWPCLVFDISQSGFSIDKMPIMVISAHGKFHQEGSNHVYSTLSADALPLQVIWLWILNQWHKTKCQETTDLFPCFVHWHENKYINLYTVYSFRTKLLDKPLG